MIFFLFYIMMVWVMKKLNYLDIQKIINKMIYQSKKASMELSIQCLKKGIPIDKIRN